MGSRRVRHAPEAEAIHFVQRLHAESALHVETRLSADGERIEWTATLSGENFLDGPWRIVREGSSRTWNGAMKAATTSFRRRSRSLGRSIWPVTSR